MIASIPSPSQGVWYLGPLPLRAYALCILLGIVVSVWWTGRRLEARGGSREAVLDVAIWAVPFGIVGGRLYHVASSWQPYFGPNGHPLHALKIWEGGLGIWGAVALGAVGAWIGCRRAGVDYLTLADSLAPPLLVAQAIGRLGNWFNNELYGAPTDAPWGLEIHQWNHTLGRAVTGADGSPVVIGTFHPTFLYELLWCLLGAALLAWIGRRPGPLYRRVGQLMALYLMVYTLGRGVIENVRIDEANHVLGLRLNVWTSIVVFALGAAWWAWLARHGRPVGEAVAPAAAPTGVATDRAAEATDTTDTTDPTGTGDPSDTTVGRGTGTPTAPDSGAPAGPAGPATHTDRTPAETDN